ncbi:MAG TPA: hypothetical protein VLM37_09205 [Fibrobacteraceae bacterium]|nr:hypothetical protein [Fibrobacteraceae bacterium]
MIRFLPFLLFCANLWAVSHVDTLILHPDGKDLAIPYQIKGTPGKKARWDTVVSTALPSWEALVTQARGQENCKQWNELLEIGQRRDSLCRVGFAEMQHQIDLETERSTNYQKSWNELLDSQKKCTQALDECTAVGKKAVAPPPVSRSWWWAWLLGGVALGFGTAFILAD